MAHKLLALFRHIFFVSAHYSFKNYLKKVHNTTFLWYLHEFYNQLPIFEIPWTVDIKVTLCYNKGCVPKHAHAIDNIKILCLEVSKHSLREEYNYDQIIFLERYVFSHRWINSMPLKFVPRTTFSALWENVTDKREAENQSKRDSASTWQA